VASKVNNLALTVNACDLKEHQFPARGGDLKRTGRLPDSKMQAWPTTTWRKRKSMKTKWNVWKAGAIGFAIGLIPKGLEVLKAGPPHHSGEVIDAAAEVIITAIFFVCVAVKWNLFVKKPAKTQP
jgi:hypothetical protein